MAQTRPKNQKKPAPSWTVYILTCADGTLYTGITTDLARRLAQHENGTGAKYTRGRGPHTILYTETHAARGDALRREAAIKALDRAAKMALAADPGKVSAMDQLVLVHGSPLVWALHALFALPTIVHILLRKDDERAAISWTGLVLLAPFFGFALYWMFGINRVKRQAKKSKDKSKPCNLFPIKNAQLPGGDDMPEQWRTLMQAGYAIHHAPYLHGNSVTPLVDGDEAYPRMIAAIDSATDSVILSSYIFDHDRAGKMFVEALARAHGRGVDVHVLLDGYFLGLRWRRTDIALWRRGIKTARYLPYRLRFINLRNHRKILSVDGRIAFAGGINIRAANLVRQAPRKPVRDLHFEITGPVVSQINDVFAEDWLYATNEKLDLPDYTGAADGKLISRVLPDGPDENYQKLEWMLIAAINAARRNIRVMTPYFIPGHSVISALQAASLRGVKVGVIVPQKNNIPFFNWAMQANFAKYLEFGIQIYETPPPFDHSKLFLIDDDWCFIGSANWDERSLALNFEINLECFDPALNQRLSQIFADRLARAIPVTAQGKNTHPLLQQLRNNFFRLFSPYL